MLLRNDLAIHWVVQIEITDQPKEVDLALLRAALDRFNVSRAPLNEKPVAAFVKQSDELVAGIDGHTYWGWLVIHRLWVSEAMRGSGLGSALLSAAEREAMDRGCNRAWLDTFSFQAKPFYEKHGYSQFGELTEYPVGFARHFLCKALGTNVPT